MSRSRSQPSKSPPERDPRALIGSTIAGRYRVESLLGKGGMGSVYRVEHLAIRKPMALKVLSDKMMSVPAVVARFEREATLAAHLDHPHVVSASDFGRTEDGRFYLVLEYVEGKELRDILDALGGPLPPVRAFYIARQIASALTRAQSQVVAWWAPSRDEQNGGLSRLLRGRRPGTAAVPDSVVPQTLSDDDALACFTAWEHAGGPVVEAAEPVTPMAPPTPSTPLDLDVRHFHRSIDTHWRRTSYSALVRVVHEEGQTVSSEPDSTLRDDESADVITDAPPGPLPGDLPSPMAELPAGAAFGSLVHAVLEGADPLAPDLTAELAARIDAVSAFYKVDRRIKTAVNERLAA